MGFIIKNEAATACFVKAKRESQAISPAIIFSHFKYNTFITKRYVSTTSIPDSAISQSDEIELKISEFEFVREIKSWQLIYNSLT